MPGPSYDRSLFETLLERLRAKSLGGDANRVGWKLRVPRQPALVLAELGGAERARLTAAGEAALGRGEVGITVLAGGAATRFGGGAKAVVPVVSEPPKPSFLAIKLADARRRCPLVAAFVMTSFATRNAIETHLDELGWCGVRPDRRFVLEQSVMPRVTLEGIPLTEVPEARRLGDAVTFAPTGHGDVLDLLRGSGALDRLRDLGARHLLVSNVDNLGATLDPLVVGAHLETNRPLTAEAIVRRPGDAGAAVCEREDGRIAIVEDPRLPAGIDPLSFPDFSINNLWIQTEAIEQHRQLDWCAVRKRVAELDREVFQLERFVNQLAEEVDAAFVVVEDKRFLPIKSQDDLAGARRQLLGFARAAGLIDPAEIDSMEGERR